MKLKNVKILSFVLAFLAVFMMLPSGSMTAYAVNDEVQADTQLQNENANGLDTQADGAIIEEETTLEIETEICYEEYAVEDLNPVAPSLSQSESSNTRDATTIADGVYAFKNIGNANMWMNVEEGNIFSNTYMCQISSTTSPVNSFDRSCLFKVTNVSGTNRYIIRSMVNNRLTFGYSNGYVKTKEIPPDDDDVDIADTFILERDSSTGYVVIKPYGSGNYCIAPNRNAESGAYLSKKTTVSAPNQIYWQMFQYTGAAQSGTVISRTAGMGDGAIKGQNYSVWLYTWSTIIGANTPYMCVHPDYASVATVGWNNTTFCATVTGTKADDLKIYAKILYDGASTSVHTGIYSFVVIPDIDGKTAFLQNVATGKYAEVDGASLAEGAVIQQISLHIDTHAQWIFELDGSGYFTIKSVNSGLYLGVPRHSVTKVKQFEELTDYMRWKIVETTSGNHKLICKASGTRYSVLAVPSTTSGDGVDLNVQSAYTDDSSYNDEWSINDHVGSLNISLYIDEGYAARYPNYASKLSQHMQDIKEKLLSDFFIEVTYSSVSSITTLADECDHSSEGNYNTECPHGDDDSSNNNSDELCSNSSFSSTGNADKVLHHKNLYNTVYRIPFPDLSETTLVLFSGHNYCEMKGKVHDNSGQYGYSWKNRGFAMITNFSSELGERKTFLHEILHWYGAPDHYNIGDAPSSSQMGPDYNPSCIFGEYRNSTDVLNNLTICEGCQQAIRDNLDKFNH